MASSSLRVYWVYSDIYKFISKRNDICWAFKVLEYEGERGLSKMKEK